MQKICYKKIKKILIAVEGMVNMKTEFQIKEVLSSKTVAILY